MISNAICLAVIGCEKQQCVFCCCYGLCDQQLESSNKDNVDTLPAMLKFVVTEVINYSYYIMLLCVVMLHPLKTYIILIPKCIIAPGRKGMVLDCGSCKKYFLSMCRARLSSMSIIYVCVPCNGLGYHPGCSCISWDRLQSHQNAALNKWLSDGWRKRSTFFFPQNWHYCNRGSYGNKKNKMDFENTIEVPSKKIKALSICCRTVLHFLKVHEINCLECLGRSCASKACFFPS